MPRSILATLVVAALAMALPASAAAFGLVGRGDRGPDVRLVQQALTELGLRTATDGVFGRRTYRNVRRYERRVDIRVDGRVSRGQARGMLRRAGMDTSLLERAPAEEQADPAAPRSLVAFGGGVFPVRGAYRLGADGEGSRFAGGGGHQGEDVMADCGTPLVAAEAGTVVFAGAHARAGHYVVIRSAASGEDHAYLHLAEPAPHTRGATVGTGTPLGAVGRSGNASACHLHFEIWTAPGWYEGGAPRDPMPDLERWAGS